MKRSLILTVVVLAVLLPFLALATEAEKEKESKELGFWFEGQAIPGKPYRLLGYFARDLVDTRVGSFGFYVFAEQDSVDSGQKVGYREAYAGPTWKPFEWLQVGVGVGRENLPNSTRKNAFFDINYKKIAVYGTFESGGRGPWHKVTATYLLTEKFGAGVMDEKDLGIGPRLQYNLRKNVQIWGALLSSHDEQRMLSTVLAINFSF